MSCIFSILLSLHKQILRKIGCRRGCVRLPARITLWEKCSSSAPHKLDMYGSPDRCQNITYSKIYSLKLFDLLSCLFRTTLFVSSITRRSISYTSHLQGGPLIPFLKRQSIADTKAAIVSRVGVLIPNAFAFLRGPLTIT